MKNNFRYKIIAGVLLVTLTLTSSIVFITTAIANMPVPINQLFPDPVLAELVAINLGLTVDDAIGELELHDIFVLNLDPYERVTDFTGVELLINLEHFYADYHGLYDLTPFANLTNLRVIDLIGNYITDLTPLANMVNLEFLDIRANNITDLSPLNGLANLEDIQFEYNPIAYFGNFTDFLELPTTVILDSFELDMTAINSLVGNPYLRELMIFDMPLNNAALNVIANLPNLEILTLAGTGIEDVSFVTSLVNLRELVLAGNDIVDTLPLSNLIQLDYLDLSSNRITDLRPLSNLNASIIAEFQRIYLPVIMVGELQEIEVYDLNGSRPVVTLAVGTGTLYDNTIIWLAESSIYSTNELFWYSLDSDFSGVFQQGVWGFEHDWYAEHLCQEEYCEIEYDYAEDCDDWIRITKEWDGDYDDFWDVGYDNGEVFDYVVYHELYSTDPVIVEILTCYYDCYAFSSVVDESGHFPEDNSNGGNDSNDDNDDLDYEADGTVIYHENEDDGSGSWDDDDLDNWDFSDGDIQTDPDFDVVAFWAAYDAANAGQNQDGNQSGNHGSPGGNQNENPVIDINVGNQYSGGSGGGVIARLPQTGVTVVAVLGVGITLIVVGVLLVVVKKRNDLTSGD